MKSMEELYSEVIASDELKAEFLEAVKDPALVEDFLKKHDCQGTAEDVMAFFREKSSPADENMKDDELAALAGGLSKSEEVALSLCTIGSGCMIHALVSYTGYLTGKQGTCEFGGQIM